MQSLDDRGDDMEVRTHEKDPDPFEVKHHSLVVITALYCHVIGTTSDLVLTLWITMHSTATGIITIAWT
jgi:hypothetical protein